MNQPPYPGPEPKKRRSALRVVMTMFAFAGLLMLIISTLTGVPVFKELRQRAGRVAEQVLPVEPTHKRAARTLSGKLNRAGLRLGNPAFIRIFKREAELEIWMQNSGQYRLLDTWQICKFSGFLGPKLAEGDKQAPEGFYAVTRKQLNPGSRHYRAFNLGFPNEYDRAHGRTGSALMVHGGCSSIGCYAMTDLGIAEIYRVVEQALKGGQKNVPVHVFPFKMTASNMSTAPVGRWNPFWKQLKVGYDLFEQTGRPPQASVCGKRYAFRRTQLACRKIAGW